MSAHILDVEGLRIVELPAEGPLLREAADLLGLAWEHQASMVAVPAARLGDDFFTLSTGIAGELVQKCVNYRVRLTILGDISGHVANSRALKGFVYESNLGNHLWFLEDREALVARLTRRSPSSGAAPTQG
ncbi:DUF4180 domain-containing protein [Pyxidicoccus fallax]|uniref:DUF4180 domain-containing protein n=1 Tax=Pyxidicoccus fallax TaxID=394095 RepID=A0A848LT20_9BACT|nr:DUF4180 domain-containing protein [Pyxidicoccus fallax]NMO20916.1 DUF4180 domain-containing protein [Pyxidicoccus fallax]NPC82064.1 DUF4180 domain-containing protein [Pyxidicoccus fallax]